MTNSSRANHHWHAIHTWKIAPDAKQFPVKQWKNIRKVFLYSLRWDTGSLLPACPCGCKTDTNNTNTGIEFHNSTPSFHMCLELPQKSLKCLQEIKSIKYILYSHWRHFNASCQILFSFSFLGRLKVISQSDIEPKFVKNLQTRPPARVISSPQLILKPILILTRQNNNCQKIISFSWKVEYRYVRLGQWSRLLTYPDIGLPKAARSEAHICTSDPLPHFLLSQQMPPFPPKDYLHTRQEIQFQNFKNQNTVRTSALQPKVMPF